jgi:hypothetical protein
MGKTEWYVKSKHWYPVRGKIMLLRGEGRTNIQTSR